MGMKMVGLVFACIVAVVHSGQSSPDCSGVTCEELGTVDPSTCKCHCRYPYTGDYCEIKNCVEGREDPVRCGVEWPQDWCATEVNMKYNCALLCGTCPSESPPDCSCVTCHELGTVDQSTCKCHCRYPYTGDYCEIKNCVEGREDPVRCGTEWPQDWCATEVNMKYNCALLCGTCPSDCATNV